MSIATFDSFKEVSKRSVTVDLERSDLSAWIAFQLQRTEKYLICSLRVGSEPTLLISVDDRWWCLQQHGSHVELFGLENGTVAGRVFEFLEPLWATVIFYPGSPHSQLMMPSLPQFTPSLAKALGAFDSRKSLRRLDSL